MKFYLFHPYHHWILAPNLRDAWRKIKVMIEEDIASGAWRSFLCTFYSTKELDYMGTPDERTRKQLDHYDKKILRKIQNINDEMQMFHKLSEA